MLQYSEVEFYVSEKGMSGAYDYDRMYVVYTLPSGIRFLKSFGYSSMLSNGGVGQASIEPLQNDLLEISTYGVYFSNGERHYIDGSTPDAKNYMRTRSKTFGSIFTKL